MNRWRIPLALALLAGLSAYVYFFEIKGEEQKAKEKEESEKVFSFQPDQITGLTLARPHEKIRLVRDAGQWTLQEPLQAPPDSDAIDRLLTSLQGARITHNLGPTKDLSAYHLQEPALTLELAAKAPKSLPALFVGDDSPTGGGTYARLGAGGPVLIVSGLEGLRGATLFSLRDKTFFKFDPAKLAALGLFHDKEEISLARKEGQWSLLSPVQAPAEDSTISDLVYALERLTVTEFVEEKPSASTLAAKGLSPPRFRIRLQGDDLKGSPELSLGTADAGSLYAVHPGSGALVKVSDSIEAKLKSSPADLRRKELMPFQRWDLAGLKASNAPAGGLQLNRKDDKQWERTAPSPAVLPDEKLDALVQALSELKGEEFLDKPSPHLASYGLDPPQSSLEFRKQGKEPAPAALLQVGKADGHGKVYAKLAAYPSIILMQEAAWKHAVDELGKVAAEKPESQPPAKPAPHSTSAAPVKK